MSRFGIAEAPAAQLVYPDVFLWLRMSSLARRVKEPHESVHRSLENGVCVCMCASSVCACLPSPNGSIPSGFFSFFALT